MKHSILLTRANSVVLSLFKNLPYSLPSNVKAKLIPITSFELCFIGYHLVFQVFDWEILVIFNSKTNF